LIAFISHAECDREALKILEDALQREAVEFYAAEEDAQPGKEISSKITEALRKSDAMIALLTEAGARSPSVNQEIGIALKSRLRIIPLVQKGVGVGVFLDSLEQFRFDSETLPDVCSRVAGYVSQLGKIKQDARDDPYLTKVSTEFVRCRNGAYAFCNCDPANVKTLLLAKYDYFVKRRELRYPRAFDNARRKRWTGEALLRQLWGEIEKAPEADRDKVLVDYVTCLYNIDAAIIAHLELREAWSRLVYRDECSKLVDAYSERLWDLYLREVRFGRSEVYRFLHEDDIVTLLNATENDAIDYIDSYLTDAMWCQLNGSYGWFDAEAERAQAKAEQKTRILNKARQIKYPFKRKLWRPTVGTRRSISPNEPTSEP
jgi:hypothetical protein